MQRIFSIAAITAITIAVGFCVLVIMAVLPYLALIGRIATGVLVLLLGCISILMLSFTRKQVSVWETRRHLIIAGDVVVYRTSSGNLLYLSAMQEQAKVSPARVVSSGKPVADKETIMELYQKGTTLRSIVEATGMSYYQVQRITSGKDD